MWDPVPWFLGGGAEHSPEVFRLMAYALTGGDEGVVSGGDLKVLPTASASMGVRASPGGAIILNRAAGQSQQAYAARNPTDDVVAIAATGASARSDMIVAQIEDPWLSGEPWADPTNPKVGPYIFTRVLSGVPADAIRPQDIAAYVGRSAIPLARIDIPANTTAAITLGMIKDLRRLAIVKNRRVPLVGQPWAAQGPLATWDKWPSYEAQVDVPRWATHATIIATAVGVKVNADIAQGSMRVLFGSLPGPHRQYDLQGVLGQIVDLDAFASLDVRALAGTTQTIMMQTIAGAAGNLITGPASQQMFDIQFEHRVS